MDKDSPQIVEALVKTELADFQNSKLRAQLSELLIPPLLQLREWDYGKSGETYPVWIVAHLGTSGDKPVAIAFSRYGHASQGKCWGLVWSDDLFFGMDSAWFERLEDLFYEWVA